MIRGNQSTSTWTKSPRDKVKVNWDVALDQKKEIIGMGAILINHEGLVMGTMRISGRFSGNAFTTECYAFFHAIRFFLKPGFVDFILEGDAKQVVNVVNGKEPNWSNGSLIT